MPGTTELCKVRSPSQNTKVWVGTVRHKTRLLEDEYNSFKKGNFKPFMCYHNLIIFFKGWYASGHLKVSVQELICGKDTNFLQKGLIKSPSKTELFSILSN